MHILGGTYGERCSYPQRDELFGSGLRAAAALADVSPSIRLTSGVCSVADADWQVSERDAAEFAARSLGVEPTWVERSKPVSWSYFTPLTAPALAGAGSRLREEIRVDDENVLVFGLVEAGPESRPRPRVRGSRVVLDPQKPRELNRSDVAEIEADAVLLILNEDETRQLGGSAVVEAAAQALLGFEGLPIEAVITKRGPRGALVTTASGTTPVAPHWTPSVYSIGSGDVFAAAAAWSWAERRDDPVTAATVGSAAAAWYCDRVELPLTASAMSSSPYRPVKLDPLARVYLAGPFFSLAQRWLVDLVEKALRPHRFSPLHDVGPGGLDVAKADLDGLNGCRSLLALLDGNDPGTVFEAGFATHANMPVVCFADHVDAEGYKMLAGTGAELTADLVTAVYHSIWAAMDPDTWRERFE